MMMLLVPSVWHRRRRWTVQNSIARSEKTYDRIQILALQVLKDMAVVLGKNIQRTS